MTDSQQHIHIIATGGTIDGSYDPANERKITKDESGIKIYISDIIKPSFAISFDTLMMIDSLDMNNDHRTQIVEALKKSSSQKIIITHGTSTMVETANFIQEEMIDTHKTIILVGALIPLEGFYPSDAAFNLGYALASAQHLEKGVFICMNGQVFSPENVYKNLEQSRFEFKD